MEYSRGGLRTWMSMRSDPQWERDAAGSLRMDKLIELYNDVYKRVKVDNFASNFERKQFEQAEGMLAEGHEPVVVGQPLGVASVDYCARRLTSAEDWDESPCVRAHEILTQQSAGQKNKI